MFRDPLAAGHAFHHAPISVVSSAILISQGETYTKYLGRIFTGTSMLVAALSAVATLRVVETLSPDRQSGIIAVIRQRHIKG